MITKQHTIPANSLLHKNGANFNYIDSFQGLIETKNLNLDISEVLHVFLISGPRWADYLMMLRDKIVGIFGLKISGDMNQKPAKKTSYEPGEQLGIFKLFDKTESEFLLGEDDKHLNFRVSLLLESISPEINKVSVTTAVKFNNMMGRIYFLPVKPVHQLLVRATVKDMIRKLRDNDYS
jgi:hypothetical protein